MRKGAAGPWGHLRAGVQPQSWQIIQFDFTVFWGLMVKACEQGQLSLSQAVIHCGLYVCAPEQTSC